MACLALPQHCGMASASRCGQHTPLLAAPEKIVKGYQVEHYIVLVIIY